MTHFVYKNNNDVFVGVLMEGLDPAIYIPKAVPKGVPYLLLAEEDIPKDVSPEAWEIDFSNPSGYGTQEMGENQ